MAISRRWRLYSCAVAVVFGWNVCVASAAPKDKAPKNEKLQKLLDEFDADGDGKIGRAEAAKIRKANAAKRGQGRGVGGGEARGVGGVRPLGPPTREGFRAVITVGGREMVFNNPGEAMAALHRIMGGRGHGAGGPGLGRGPGNQGFEGRGQAGGGFGRGPGGPPRDGEVRGRGGPQRGGEARGRGGPQRGGGEARGRGGPQNNKKRG